MDHRSAVADFDDIEEDPGVDQLYVDEMTELLRRISGADAVIMLGGGKKRYGEAATDKLLPLKNAKPARYPHADVTDESGPLQAMGLVGTVPGLDLADYGRWALFNRSCASYGVRRLFAVPHRLVFLHD